MRLMGFIPPMVAAIGGFMYGVDTGIIATTIAHDSFKLYMFGPSMRNASLEGAIVSCYMAGQCVGTLIAGWMADRISRKYTLSAAGLVAIIGIILQTAAQNIGMFIAGRLLTGFASGMSLPIVPVYIAELSPPNRRAAIVGFQGVALAIGFFAANWIGYGGSFAVGNAQWRIPVAMQLPGAAGLLIGTLFIPFSPRWLMSKDRYDEARAVMSHIHSGRSSDFLDQQMVQMREQIGLERSYTQGNWIRKWLRLFKRQYIERTLLCSFLLAYSQFSGSLVIQNFQSIFYAAVGFAGQTTLLISGVYGIMGVIGQTINLFVVADRWPRVRTLWVGTLVLAVMLSICMALSAEFGDGSNQAASRATIAFIFIYSACYAIFFNSTIWVVGSEMWPVFLRSNGMAFGTFVQGVWAIVLTQISPIAMDNIGWRFYAVFIACNVAASLIFFFLLPETMGKSLEEIAELFGDTLATEHLGEIDLHAKGAGVEEREHATEAKA